MEDNIKSDTPPTTIEDVKKTVVFIGSTLPQISIHFKDEIQKHFENVEFVMMDGELYDYCLNYATKKLLKSNNEETKMSMVSNAQLRGEASKKAVKLYNLAFPLAKRFKRDVTKRDLINTGKIKQGELNELLDFLKLFGYVALHKSHIQFLITPQDHLHFLEEKLMESQQKIIFYQDMRERYLNLFEDINKADNKDKISNEDLANVYKDTLV